MYGIILADIQKWNTIRNWYDNILKTICTWYATSHQLGGTLNTHWKCLQTNEYCRMILLKVYWCIYQRLHIKAPTTEVWITVSCYLLAQSKNISSSFLFISQFDALCVTNIYFTIRCIVFFKFQEIIFKLNQFHK
jgi:hypothetical protein